MPPLREPSSDVKSAHAGTRICVTGGAGFIGSRLVETLLSLGASVAAIDDLSAGNAERIAVLIDRHPPDRLRFVHGSILDPGALADAMEGARLVYHLAAQTSVAQSQDEPARCFEVNALGTLRVAEAARRAGAQRLVYTSSSSVYGDAPPPQREDQTPTNPISPYAASKLSGEHVVGAWARSLGLSGVSLRLFNVYGPGQRADDEYSAVIPAFVSRVAQGRAPIVHGDGSQTRDFAHVDDVVAALLTAGAIEHEPQGEAVNIGSARAISVLELANLVLRLAGRDDLSPTRDAARPGDVPHSCAETSRAAETLGFSMEVELERGLGELLGLHDNHQAPVG